jgi:hypothetical protein
MNPQMNPKKSALLENSFLIFWFLISLIVYGFEVLNLKTTLLSSLQASSIMLLMLFVLIHFSAIQNYFLMVRFKFKWNQKIIWGLVSLYALGQVLFTVLEIPSHWLVLLDRIMSFSIPQFPLVTVSRVLGVLAIVAIILFIRWVYKTIVEKTGLEWLLVILVVFALGMIGFSLIDLLALTDGWIHLKVAGELLFKVFCNISLLTLTVKMNGLYLSYLKG